MTGPLRVNASRRYAIEVKRQRQPSACYHGDAAGLRAVFEPIGASLGTFLARVRDSSARGCEARWWDYGTGVGACQAETFSRNVHSHRIFTVNSRLVPSPSLI